MSGCRVLVVEDNSVLRRLIGKSLSFCGYRVSEAADGKSAVDQVLASRPELILIDLEMPGPVSGIEAVRTLKEDPETRSIPIVGMTSRPDESKENLEVDHAVPKPVDTRALPALLAGFLAT